MTHPGSDDRQQVTAHYGGAGLRAAIEAALVDAGKDLGRLTTRDLAPVDEFHSRGRRATVERNDRQGRLRQVLGALTKR